MSCEWLLFLVSVVIVTTNAITIVIFITCPRLRMRRYILIVNLAVADCLVGLTAVPLFTYFVYINPSSNTITVHNVHRAFDMVFGIGSLFSLSAVTVERTYATYFPFKHRVLSKTKYTVGICIVWSTSVMLCVLMFLLPNSESIVNVVTILVFAILCPISMIIISYILIWIKVNYNRALPRHTTHQSNAKLTVTLGLVTLVTIIAWIPFTIVSMEYHICFVYGKCNRALTKPTIINISKWLQYSNSIVNFVIYALRMRDFKMELKRRMRCCCGRQLSPEVRRETPNNNQLTTRCD